MIGALSFLRHQQQHDIDTFKEHWLKVHGPLAAVLPGVKKYTQNHFIPTAPLTNALARSLEVDGLAAMFFENEADRDVCYSCRQEAICDEDSLQFIGATARFVTDVQRLIPAKKLPAAAKAVFAVLATSTLDAKRQTEKIATLDGLTELTFHGITKPGAIPFQPRTQISMPLQAIIEVSADKAEVLEQARDAFVPAGEAGVAIFSVQEYSLV